MDVVIVQLDTMKMDIVSSHLPLIQSAATVFTSAMALELIVKYRVTMIVALHS